MLHTNESIKTLTSKKSELKKRKREPKKNNYPTLEEQINCFAEIIANYVLKNYEYDNEKQ